MPPRRPQGPRGGTTTVTPGGYRSTHVYLDPDTLRRVKRLAAEMECSVSEVVRRAIDAYDPKSDK
jgi:hypothetical protein